MTLRDSLSTPLSARKIFRGKDADLRLKRDFNLHRLFAGRRRIGEAVRAVASSGRCPARRLCGIGVELGPDHASAVPQRDPQIPIIRPDRNASRVDDGDLAAPTLTVGRDPAYDVPSILFASRTPTACHPAKVTARQRLP